MHKSNLCCIFYVAKLGWWYLGVISDAFLLQLGFYSIINMISAYIKGQH